MPTRCALASARSGPGSTWFFTPASSQSVGQAPGLPTLLLDACSGHREADLRLLLSPRERGPPLPKTQQRAQPDRKSTRLNSSHLGISYAVFCLKKKHTSTHLHSQGSGRPKRSSSKFCTAPG